MREYFSIVVVLSIFNSSLVYGYSHQLPKNVCLHGCSSRTNTNLMMMVSGDDKSALEKELEYVKKEVDELKDEIVSLKALLLCQQDENKEIANKYNTMLNKVGQVLETKEKDAPTTTATRKRVYKSDNYQNMGDKMRRPERRDPYAIDPNWWTQSNDYRTMDQNPYPREYQPGSPRNDLAEGTRTQAGWWTNDANIESRGGRNRGGDPGWEVDSNEWQVY